MKVIPCLITPIVLVITGCANQPEVVEVKVPVPIVTPCQATYTPPEVCKPADDGRVEALRCFLADRINFMAYSEELEKKLEACK